jgi:hypothetical protein
MRFREFEGRARIDSRRQTVSQLQAMGYKTCESSRVRYIARLTVCSHGQGSAWSVCFSRIPAVAASTLLALPEPIEILPPMSLPAEDWSRPLHASSSGVTVQTRRLRVVVLRCVALRCVECASRCRDAAGMPKTRSLHWPGTGLRATTQRYEALPPVARSTMAYCGKLLVLHGAHCGLEDPYLGKAARCQSGGGYDGAKSWRVGEMSGQS